MKLGYEILNNPFLNKGTAFTKKEREEYKTTEYPRTELIRTTIGQKVIAVRDKILSIFRATNGK